MIGWLVLRDADGQPHRMLNLVYVERIDVTASDTADGKSALIAYGPRRAIAGDEREVFLNNREEYILADQLSYEDSQKMLASLALQMGHVVPLLVDHRQTPELIVPQIHTVVHAG